MQTRFEARRRILIAAYRRYLAADRALQSARGAARVWCPETPVRGVALIGDPGSRVRRLYERRERALARLTIARSALDDARQASHTPAPLRIRLIDLRGVPGI